MAVVERYLGHRGITKHLPIQVRLIHILQHILIDVFFKQIRFITEFDLHFIVVIQMSLPPSEPIT
ncbi:hypothetical protein SDC9_179369 [bioreactor metagenome]|uniref:Uncharacterized protein n=1 Tax=bioreactor metagenome TaxID=1076179 RepID=A0A645H6J8_9ZZZZ